MAKRHKEYTKHKKTGQSMGSGATKKHGSVRRAKPLQPAHPKQKRAQDFLANFHQQIRQAAHGKND